MIVVNARFLNQKITGVQRFSLELSRRLKMHYGDDVEFVTHPGIIHEKLAEELCAKVIGTNPSHLWEQLDLYYYLLRNKCPLLVSFGYTGPLFYKKQIISVHDMAFKLYKETFSKGFSFAYNFLVPRISNKCLHVFTVSETSKIEIARELGINQAKVTVVYNGLSDVFKQKINKNQNTLHGEYILTVSSHHPRKNYKRLINAFSLIEDSNLKLLVIGNKIDHFTDDLDIDIPKLDQRVVFLSNITDDELVGYYEDARLFVFPSLYEGFGIPVIEAMSRGKTCVLSDIPVFKEIGDDQVVYVDPLNVDSIKSGIEYGLKLQKTKKEYNKLSNFNWDKSANNVISIIEKYR